MMELVSRSSNFYHVEKKFAVTCPMNQNFHTSFTRPSVRTVHSTATLIRYSISGNFHGSICTAISATVVLAHRFSNDTILEPTPNKRSLFL